MPWPRVTLSAFVIILLIKFIPVSYLEMEEKGWSMCYLPGQLFKITIPLHNDVYNEREPTHVDGQLPSLTYTYVVPLRMNY